MKARISLIVALVPDQLKAAVTGPCRYEPAVNRTHAEMAAHYGAVVVPARPARPRDKAKVEAGVLVAEHWILAALRHRTFFSLAELNQAIRERLQWLRDGGQGPTPDAAAPATPSPCQAGRW